MRRIRSAIDGALMAGAVVLALAIMIAIPFLVIAAAGWAWRLF